MKIRTNRLLAGALPAFLLLAGCGNGDAPPSPVAETPVRAVETSGKTDTGLESVPEEVLAAARAARPELEVAEAEYEVRDGREYYDLGGTLPDGSELELDLTRLDGVWKVVEVQRDLSLEQVPEPVRQALSAPNPDWLPTRILESDQGDGVVIYEFFGPGPDGGETKVEVKWANGAAEVLRDEWLH